jgi:hypothetical protein
LIDRCTAGSKLWTPRLARVTPAAPSAAAMGGRERARVDLHGDLGPGVELEPSRDQAAELGSLHNGRGASAEMDVPHRSRPAEPVRHELDLPLHCGKVARNGFVTSRDRRMTAAVPAHGAAEWHVEVERRGGLSRKRREPSRIGVSVHALRELGASRVAGVAGKALLSVARPDIFPQAVLRKPGARTGAGAALVLPAAGCALLDVPQTPAGIGTAGTILALAQRRAFRFPILCVGF